MPEKTHMSQNHRPGHVYALLTALCLFIASMGLTGCDSPIREDTGEGDVYLYYVTNDDSGVVPVPFDAPAIEQGDLDDEEYMIKVIRSWISSLSGVPADVSLKSPIDADMGIQSIRYLSGQVTIDFKGDYLLAEPMTEVLRRAAIVKTLVQIDGVEGIAFTVEGIPITDSKQVAIGVMTDETFVSNPGAEINAYETTKVQVYFTDETGEVLVGRTENVGYISNISMERLVVDRVIAGPLNNRAYPTVSPTLKVLNVTTKDGICYVNLDNSFLTKTLKVSDEVVIYSFVNSLTELPNVSKVQFMIDSETEVTFGDHIYLSEPFERNLEIISSAE
ncbi:MAG: GerMN domain-containing protein [Lachnospiraceae bacterium]|nr:GerMN domain-containing protein [Lachnospiraceae bacterium]